MDHLSSQAPNRSTALLQAHNKLWAFLTFTSL